MPRRPFVEDKIPVYNNTGSALAAGTLIHTTSYNIAHNAFHIALSMSDALTTLAQYAVIAPIADGKRGFVSRSFSLLGQDTSAGAVGDIVYLSSSSGGTWTVTAPSGANYIQRVGKIGIADATAGAVNFDIVPGQLSSIPTHTHLDASQGGDAVHGGTLRNVITDPGNAGAIPVTESGTCLISSAGAETRTLAIPTFVGQELMLAMNTDGGDVVITSAQGINASGNTSITMNDAGDILHLIAVRVTTALRWRVLVNATCTLA